LRYPHRGEEPTMKKALTVLAVLGMTFGLTACETLKNIFS
jgi:hypothetical protein